MFELKKRKYLANTEKPVRCPKCQSPLESRVLRSGVVEACPIGCGIWVSGTAIKANAEQLLNRVK